MATSGTLRKLGLDGIDFTVTAEINVTLNQSPVMLEGQATSGRTMYKRTMRIQTAEGVTISATPDEQVSLVELADRDNPFPVTATLASGETYITTARINYENVETETNTANVMIIPDRIGTDTWKLFGA